MKPLLSPQTHRTVYHVLLAILGASMVCSYGLSSVSWVLLSANWLLEGRWREKWALTKQSRLIHAIAFFFLMHLVALLWSDNLGQGLRSVSVLLPFFAVSSILLTTPPPQGKTRLSILAVYASAVFVVTLIGFFRWLSIPDLPYRDIVPYISNIRFSLNCCMVIFLLMLPWPDVCKQRWISALRILLILWLLFVLLLLRSYTGLVVLLCVTPLLIVRSRRLKLLALWGAAVVAVIVMVAAGCRSYYRLSPLAEEPLKPCTLNGRPYTHKQDGLIENGNYVNNYICTEELHAEWFRRTGMDAGSPTLSGSPVELVLIRYLNALGLTKDSVGVASLSDSQIDEIKRGIANPVYLHGSQPQKMLYVILFEYENYRCYRAVAGFSMLQRVELWKCAWKVFLRHPLFGTGTGDLLDEMHLQHLADGSLLAFRRLSPHNQYLTTLAMFGLLGFVLTVVLLLRAAIPALRPRGSLRNSALMAVWVAALLISCLTENTPASLAGGLFCSWFLAFRAEKNNFSPTSKHQNL